MRVLMTADTVGGVWTYAIELAEALGARGAEVTLATMGAPLDRDQEVEARRLRVRSSAFALEWMEEPWDDVERAGEWLLELAGEARPDLVHLNGYAHASLEWRAPVVVVAHSDVLTWHQAVRGRPAGPEWRRYREAVAAGLAAADLLVAPTRTLLDAIVRLYEPRCRRVAIPNGSGRTFPTRAKEPLVLGAGRLWDEAKNAAALARVAPRLDWPVALAGDAGADLAGVRLLGKLGRRELDGWLARAAIFAAPARYEPFGLAALEAGRAGCALVLGDLASLREVWGDAALYADPEDDEALADRLRALIADEPLLRRLAGRARARSLVHSIDAAADAYLAAYRGLLAQEAAA